MYAISLARSSKIRSIVDEQTCFAAARNLGSTARELIKSPHGQRLLAYLEKGNFCVDRSLKQPEDFRSCLRSRRAARYRVNK